MGPSVFLPCHLLAAPGGSRKNSLTRWVYSSSNMFWVYPKDSSKFRHAENRCPKKKPQTTTTFIVKVTYILTVTLFDRTWDGAQIVTRMQQLRSCRQHGEQVPEKPNLFTLTLLSSCKGDKRASLLQIRFEKYYINKSQLLVISNEIWCALSGLVSYFSPPFRHLRGFQFMATQYWQKQQEGEALSCE